MFAVVFVGFPGLGKTVIGRELVRHLRHATHIKQDDYYLPSGRCDRDGYLHAIVSSIPHYDYLILEKNHHTTAEREEVLSILRHNQIPFLIVNLVPSNFLEQRERREMDPYLDHLLGRILERSRTGTDSHLISSSDSEKESRRIRAVLMHGFLLRYEEPTEPFLRLEEDSIDEKVRRIVEEIPF